MRLEQKVALVTGGGRGIGRETSVLLASEGAKVALFADDEREVEETADFIRKQGGEAIAIFGDVRSENSVNAAAQTVLDAFGRIDILVNNAGVMIIKPFLEMTVSEWDWIHDVNLRGVYLFSRAVIPHMVNQQSGVIVNVSSIWGTKGGPNRSAYISSKFAVIGLTRALAEEYRSANIRVNAVCPGPVRTKMMEDLAPGATRFCSGNSLVKTTTIRKLSSLPAPVKPRPISTTGSERTRKASWWRTCRSGSIRTP